MRTLLSKLKAIILFPTGKVIVSGIDKIDKDIRTDSVMELNLPEGCYSVKIYLIAWDEEVTVGD